MPSNSTAKPPSSLRLKHMIEPNPCLLNSPAIFLQSLSSTHYFSANMKYFPSKLQRRRKGVVVHDGKGVVVHDGIWQRNGGGGVRWMRRWWRSKFSSLSCLMFQADVSFTHWTEQRI